MQEDQLEGDNGPSNFLMRKHERLQSQISEISFSEEQDWQE